MIRDGDKWRERERYTCSLKLAPADGHSGLEPRYSHGKLCALLGVCLATWSPGGGIVAVTRATLPPGVTLPPSFLQCSVA